MVLVGNIQKKMWGIYTDCDLNAIKVWMGSFVVVSFNWLYCVLFA